MLIECGSQNLRQRNELLQKRKPAVDAMYVGGLVLVVEALSLSLSPSHSRSLSLSLSVSLVVAVPAKRLPAYLLLLPKMNQEAVLAAKTSSSSSFHSRDTAGSEYGLRR